jgi:hypothetical protein
MFQIFIEMLIVDNFFAIYTMIGRKPTKGFPND